MIKLIASDLDGTLLPYGSSAISATAKKLIYQALDTGISFAVSSGRTYRQLVSLLPEFENDIYFIADDGAYCVKSGKVLYSKHIDKEELSRVTSVGASLLPCVLHGAFKDYFLGDIPKEYTQDFITRENAGIFPYDGSDRIYKITSFSPLKRLPLYSKLRLHWNDGENKAFAQYVNRFSNKGAALSDLKIRLLLSGLDTAVIGDMDNDIPMMRGAKYAYAIGDRSKGLAAVATHTAETAECALASILAKAK